MAAIRDPIHDWISFSSAEHRIIDCPLFQRLNWVSQLSTVRQVFPGGVHTRFSHSLGAMHLAGRYMSHLMATATSEILTMIDATGYSSDYYIKLARVAGLLHDIGHGPFSHAFDRAIYQQIYGIVDGGHDLHRLKIIASPSMAPLIADCGVAVNDLLAVWSSHSEPYETATISRKRVLDIVRAVVQGPLGADRMDFVTRDSFFTGTTHLGTISTSRIIDNARLILFEGHISLHYQVKCLADIIHALTGRHHMYDSVYLHKTCDASNILVEMMMQKAEKGLRLRAQTEDLTQFQYLNDYTVIGAVMASENISGEMCEARMLCQCLLERRLPKKVWEVMEVTADAGVDDAIYLSQAWDALPAELRKKIKQEDLLVRRTRTLQGIDANKFDRHHIRFWTGDESITCEQALTHIHYTRSQGPYRLIRVYIWNPKEQEMPISEEL